MEADDHATVSASSASSFN